MTKSQAQRALALFDKCKSTLLNGSVQSYLIPLQHVETIRAALTDAIDGGNKRIDRSKLELAETIADSGLEWCEHKDFARVYTALQKVFNILKEINAPPPASEQGEKL